MVFKWSPMSSEVVRDSWRWLQMGLEEMRNSLRWVADVFGSSARWFLMVGMEFASDASPLATTRKLMHNGLGASNRSSVRSC